MDQFLFVFHITVIILAILSGFFLPLALVAALIALHKLHLVIFGDCILTLYKRYRGALRNGENFIQYTVQKIWRKKITQHTSNAIHYGIYALTICASIVRDSLL